MRISFRFCCLPLLMIGCCTASLLPGQSVTVRLVNGKNLKPMVNKKIYIRFPDDPSGREIALETDKQGSIYFDATGHSAFEVHPIAVVPCGEQPVGYPIRSYQVLEVVKSGFLTKNDCGKRILEPIRGQLTYFARPATTWELFRN
jgi:hypothetical protein